MRNALVIGIFVGASLSGCATGDIQLGDSNGVSQAGDALSNKGSAYVQALQKRRREALVALVASDPSCSWTTAGVAVRTDWSPGQPLCAPGAPKVRLRSVSAAAVQPTLDLIKAVALYQKALADIVGRPTADVSGDINAAIADAQRAASAVNQIAGDKIADLSVLSGAQAKAAVELIDDLSKLAQTERKTEDLRRAVTDAKIDSVIDELVSSTNSLNAILDENSALTLRAALSHVYETQGAKLPFEGRRELLDEIATAQDDLDHPELRAQDLGAAAAKLKATQRKLLDALNGRYTDAERAQIARTVVSDIIGVLATAASLFPVV